MIDISKLRIDPASLGEKLLLTEVNPWFEYVDGKKQDIPMGYKYTVACTAHALNTITVKVKGKQMVEATDEFPAVKFSGLELKVYVIEGKPMITAIATGIALVNKASA